MVILRNGDVALLNLRVKSHIGPWIMGLSILLVGSLDSWAEGSGGILKITRVAKFACPRVHDDQKMSEDNQKLRSGCPPDYQIFWEKYFENNCPYNSLRILFSPFPFPTNIYHFGNLKKIAYHMRATKYMSRTTRFQILVFI